MLLVVWLDCYAQKKQSIVVVFYNVENLFDTINDPRTDDDAFTPRGSYKYTTNIYKQKVANVAYVLQQMDKAVNGSLAVVGLAEIENGKVLADVTSHIFLAKKGYKHISFDSPDPRGIDVALLYDPKQFRPLSQKPVNANMKEEPTRDILYVVGVFGKDTVHILVNHWPSRREGKGETAPKRAQVAATNKRMIDSLVAKNVNAKIILMGDLNDNPDDESAANVLGAKGGRDGVKPRPLYNPFAELYASGAGSAAFQKKWNLFDQVIVSRSFMNKNNKGLRYEKAEVFNRDFLITHSGKQQGYPYRSWRGYQWMNGYSDHLPVIVYFSR